MKQQLTNSEKYTLHCWNSITDNYNRGFLVKITNNKARRVEGASRASESGKETELQPKNKKYQTFEIVLGETDAIIKSSGEDIGILQPEVVPDVHPAFQSRQNNSLFHCLADAVDIHLKDEVKN